jgi:hypothetical protein
MPFRKCMVVGYEAVSNGDNVPVLIYGIDDFSIQEMRECIDALEAGLLLKMHLADLGMEKL